VTKRPPSTVSSFTPGRPTGAQAFELAVRNPALAAAAELKSRSEHKLVDFIRLMWPVIERNNPLRVGKAFEAIAEHLQAVHEGHIRKLLINCPPGFSKSTLLNVFFPAWEWGPRNRPDLRVIAWSYGEHLTVRDNEKCMTLIDSPIYQALWGGRFEWNKRQLAKDYYKNNHEGFRIAAGVRGMGTGERGDRVHIDDPLNAAAAASEAELLFANNWFNATVTTRVRNANPYKELVEGIMVEPSATVMIMQRLHHRDPSGIIIEEELTGWEHLLIEMEFEGDAHPARRHESKKKPGTLTWKGSSIGYVDWRYAQVAEVERLKAEHAAQVEAELAQARELEATQWWAAWGAMWLDIADDIARLADPVRFSRAAVEELKERLLLTIGSNAVASQLRQWPSEGSGDLFKPENWQFCEVADVPPSMTLMDVRGWDLAASEQMTSDGTGAVKLRRGRDKKFYVMHAQRVREKPGGVRKFRDEMRAMDGPNVIQDFPQDPGQAGVDQVASIRQEDATVTTRSSPESGSKVTRAMPASGFQEIGMVVIVRGDWNREFIDELADFPNGRYSALVDGFSRAFNRLAAMPAMQIPGGADIVAGKTMNERKLQALEMPRLNASIPRPEVDDFDGQDDD
jgi:predicted phage terminase large subunit-like protein